MSSFDRRSLLIGLAALTGCGFAPVYGPGGEAEALRGAIRFDPPRDPEGFALVRRLEDRLGRPEAPEFRLAAEITLDQDQAGITPDQVITRYNVLGGVTWRLLRLADDSDAASGSATSFTSYATTGTPVATQAAERDAIDRLMIILADRIVADLLLTARDWRA